VTGICGAHVEHDTYQLVLKVFVSNEGIHLLVCHGCLFNFLFELGYWLICHHGYILPLLAILGLPGVRHLL
jgi:hypothetical protein